MGLYTRRHDSSRAPFPPTISVPTPPLLHNPPVGPTSNKHSNSLPPISPPPNASFSHSRNESSPLTSSPPISPPSISGHSRRDSYPGPFPSLPPSPSNFEQHSLFHSRNESCPHPFPFPSSPRHHQLDPSLLPSTSSPQKRLRIRNRNDSVTDLLWPFGEIEGNGVDDDDIRETAYEVFFTACRSSPGFGGRSALTFYSRHENGNGNGNGNGGGMSQVPVSLTSRVKRALGLKMLRSSFSQRMVSRGGWSSMPSSPVAGDCSPRARVGLPRRTMTMAEIMRLQMGVSELSDSRLRKTLMRTLVGQVIILE